MIAATHPPTPTHWPHRNPRLSSCDMEVPGYPAASPYRARSETPPLCHGIIPRPPRPLEETPEPSIDTLLTGAEAVALLTNILDRAGDIAWLGRPSRLHRLHNNEPNCLALGDGSSDGHSVALPPRSPLTRRFLRCLGAGLTAALRCDLRRLSVWSSSCNMGHDSKKQMLRSRLGEGVVSMRAAMLRPGENAYLTFLPPFCGSAVCICLTVSTR